MLRNGTKSELIIAETKWPPFYRHFFKCLSFNEYCIFIEILLKSISVGHKQLVIIGSNNGLAPSIQLAIIWTNDGGVY